MDTRARLALEDVVRRTVAGDLDAMAGELQLMRRRLDALEHLSGLPAEPRGQGERRARVLELRETGLSTRTIAAVVGCDRGTVLKDLRALQAPALELIRGMDGRFTRPPQRDRPQPSA